MSAHVYRVFDEHGRLLYIGCTTDPQNRFGGHRRQKAAWLPYAASVSWETHRTIGEGLTAETLAILFEHPRFNKHHNPPFTNKPRAPFPDATVLNTPVMDLLRGAPGRRETVHDRKRAALQLLHGGAA